MLNDYQRFVQSTTSKQSLEIKDFTNSCEELAQHIHSVPLLLTASIGLASECGEFSEIVKKLVFQGKPFTGTEHYHMVRELGDVAWYLANACTALGVSFEDVIKENISKLEARYPNGFEVVRSENRAEGDL